MGDTARVTMTESDNEERAGEESPPAPTGMRTCVNKANNLEKRKSSIDSTKKPHSLCWFESQFINHLICTRKHHCGWIGTHCGVVDALFRDS